MAAKERKTAAPAAPATLPEGWRRVKFGDVVREAKVTVDPETSGLERYVAGEHMDTDDLRIRHWGTIGDGYLGPAFHRKFVKGQVLYGSRRTYLRKVAVAEFDGICANTTFVLEPKGDDLLPELLPFIMQTESFSTHAVKQSRGSVNPYVNFRDIAWYEFPLPPKSEQHRIADILWAAEEERRALDRAEIDVEKTKRLLIESLLTKKALDEAWENVPISDLGEVVTGATPDTKKREFYGKDFMFVSPADISESQWVSSTEKQISALGLASVREVPANSVMVVCIGSTIGKVAMASERCATNQQINTVICNRTCDPVFVYYLLKSNAGEFRRLASCTAVPILNKSTFSSIRVSKPPLSEQIKIAGIANQHDEGLENLREKRRKVNNLKAMLLRQLLPDIAEIE